MSNQATSTTSPASNVVTMLDPSTPFGTSVDFGAKNKTRTIVQVVGTGEAGQESKVSMFWAFRNGKVSEFTFPFSFPESGLSLTPTIMANGIQQKVGDTYSSVLDPDDIQMVVDMTIDNIKAGRWSRGATPGIPGLSGDLIEAVRRAFAKNLPEFADEITGREKAKEYLKAKYNSVLDLEASLRVPTGDAAADAERIAKADKLSKSPFSVVLAFGDVQRNLATIKREKAEAAEGRKLQALEQVELNLADLFDKEIVSV
jgi:hypothetical protein